MDKKKLLLRILMALFLTVSAVAMGFLLRMLLTDLPQNVTGLPVTLRAELNDGAWELSWTPFDPEGNYTLKVSDLFGNTRYRDRKQSGESARLPAELPEGSYAVRLSGNSRHRLFRKKTFSVVLELTDIFPQQNVRKFDTDKKELLLCWSGSADSYILYELGDDARAFADTADTSARICFGVGDAPTIPAVGDTAIIAIAGERVFGDCTVRGALHELVCVTRDELYGTALDLQFTVDEKNRVSFSWQETKGESYELSVKTPGGYRPVFTADMDTLSFTTASLRASANFEFRLRACDGDGNTLCEASAAIRTGISPLDASVWPNKKLDIYADADKSEKLGTVDAVARCCVLDEDEEKEMFLVLLPDGSTGWIESSFCMINLPEYIGDLVSYDITNSYNSLYTLHEYEVYGITGSVVRGYENVRLADGSFAVPLLYPTAQKLIAAAEAAEALGCRLRIYDAYRPRMASLSISERVSMMLPLPLPASTYTGNRVSLPPIGSETRDERLMIDFVENYGWGVGSFIAQTSCHNKGVALDLALEDAVTGQLLPAQTLMHDLSVFSTTRSNNDNAAMLYDIMTSAERRRRNSP